MTEKAQKTSKKKAIAPTWLREPEKTSESLSWETIVPSTFKLLAKKLENPYKGPIHSGTTSLTDWLDGFSVNDQQEVVGRMQEVLPWVDLVSNNPQALFTQPTTYTTCSTFLHNESITIRSLHDGKNVALGIGTTPTAVAKIHTYRERLPKKGSNETPITGLQVQIKDLSPEHTVHLDEIRSYAQELAAIKNIGDSQKNKLAKLRRTLDSYPVSQLILTVNRTTWDYEAENPRVLGGKGKVHDEPLFSIAFKRVPNARFERGEADEVVVELKNIQTTKDKNPHKTITIPLHVLSEKFTDISLEKFEEFLTRVYNDIANYSQSDQLIVRRKSASKTQSS
jgi:hypothetical protein